MNNIGNRIKAIREERGYTLQELGKRINFDYTNLSKIENGKRKPTIELLESLSDFFDKNISYFYGEEINVPKELKEKGAKWIAFGEEMEKRDLTPEELKRILKIVDMMKDEL